jgi:hypothetical protein
MNRSDVVNWLNHRNSLAKSNRLVGFDQTDVDFFRNYIHYYKNKLVDPNEIIQAILHNHPEQVLSHLDFICTKLVTDFNITIKIVKKLVNDPSFYLMLHENPFQHREIEFIEEYS